MPRGDSSAAQVVACALALFARHGVAGTSLQMIADELGVTKAAVYYRFRTKEEIVLAVLAPAFEGFAAILEEAEAEPVERRAGLVLDRLARQAVTHRALYAVVLGDLSATQLRGESPEALAVFERLRDTLAGPAPTPDRTARAAIFLSGLVGPHVDPALRRLSDQDLEAAIAGAGRDMLGIAG
jgi:AcrR family transcriptional regulator